MTADDEAREEVSYTDYQKACAGLEIAARALRECDPDEGAMHWLPQVVRHTAIIFSFVGSNMTARHVPRYLRTVAAHEAAKDVTVQSQPGRLPGEPNTGGKDGGITDAGGDPGPGGDPRPVGPDPGEPGT